MLRGPAMNRSWNRENPDILIAMIAGGERRERDMMQQMVKGCEEDKVDQSKAVIANGPSKACNTYECLLQPTASGTCILNFILCFFGQGNSYSASKSEGNEL